MRNFFAIFFYIHGSLDNFECGKIQDQFLDVKKVFKEY